MRENESEGGWRQPHEHVSPWVPHDQGRDEDEAAGTRWPGANAAPPPEKGHRDTIAFGAPAGQAWYENEPGHGDQAGNGQAWYVSQDDYGAQAGYRSQDDYGAQAGYRSQDDYRAQAGYQAQASEDPGGHRAGGGHGATGRATHDPPPGRRGRGGRFLVYVAVAALAASIGAGVTVAADSQSPAPAAGISSNNTVPGPRNNAAGSGSSSAPLNPAAVVKKVDPGLVDIVATLKYEGETAEGTGMIISPSGLVLTNNHVIDGATTVRATLVDPGGNSARSYPAQIVGYDATDDVALLQLQGASGLPTESFGDSSQVSLGTPVLALGNAEGRGGATPAPGIVNALNRSIQASDQGSNSTEDLNHMLQTNARIQQGDSGGALANSAGQVIGMITAANTSTSNQLGPSNGTLGFAIPIDSALALARQIKSGQSSATVYIGLPGFLGVEVATSSSPNPQRQAADEAQGGSGSRAPAGSGSSCRATNQQVNIPAQIAPGSSGALVLGVLCGTAASGLGLVPGDVILSVEGQAITTPDSLTSIAAQYHPGDIVSVDWESADGATHTRSIVMGFGPAR